MKRKMMPIMRDYFSDEGDGWQDNQVWIWQLLWRVGAEAEVQGAEGVQESGGSTPWVARQEDGEDLGLQHTATL